MSTVFAAPNVQTVKRIAYNSPVPDEIQVTKFEMDRVLFHLNCDCRMYKNVMDIYDKDRHYLFQQRGQRGKTNIWYLVNKSSVPLIIERSFDIFPCNGIFDRNGFIWFISESYATLSYLKERSDEVMKVVASKDGVKRDYHSAAILRCKKKGYRIDGLITDETIGPDIHYGFTCAHMPRNENMFVLGIVQKKTGKYKYDNFNAPGGKKEMIWNGRNGKFTMETTEKSSIRETWEELGIEIDTNLFNYCFKLSREHRLNPDHGTINENVFVYKLYVPSLETLQFKKSYWNDPERCRYVVSLKEMDY